MTLPNKKGFHEISLEDNLSWLFEMDCEIFNNPPVIFPFDNEKELYKYLMQDHNTRTFILNNDLGEIVGYFSFEESIDAPNMFELINIGVRPQFQGQGFARNMIDHYHDLIKDKNSRLVTHPENKSSRKLYEKNGYIPVKIIHNYFGDGEDRVLYIRLI